MRDFGALGPKWIVFTEPSLLGSGTHVKEEAER